MITRHAHFVWMAILLATLPVSAVTYYVDVNSTNPVPPYTNWFTAANVIQDAVDAASLGDTVLVTNGVYDTGGKAVYGTMTNRVAVDKPLKLMSVNGPEFTVIKGYQVPVTTNGDWAIRCVYLTNEALIAGFTLSDGATRTAGDGITEQSGGGLWCESTNATATNCFIRGNRAASQGGGVYSGLLVLCDLTENTAGLGGGAHGSTLESCNVSHNSAGSGGGVRWGILTGCRLVGNYADFGGGCQFSTASTSLILSNSASSGGGAYRGTLTSCSIEGNTATEGGGAWTSTLYNCYLSSNFASVGGGGAAFGTLNNSSITGNTASEGGGTYQARLFNCTVVGNSASFRGGGCSGGILRNCIAYYNVNTSSLDADNFVALSGSSVAYSCVIPLPLSGLGNISSEPLLASATHLSPTSPCRGAGSTGSTSGTDIDGEPWADPASIGCDEYWTGAITGALTVAISATYTNVAVGFPVRFAAAIDGHPALHKWDFGDSNVISNQPLTSHSWSVPGDYEVVLTAYNETWPGGVSAVVGVHVETPVHLISINSTNPIPPYTSWATAATNIQHAIDVASVPGALVLVSNGVYSSGGKGVAGFMTNRVAVDKPLRVESVNGPDVTFIEGFQVPGTTNGDGAIRCVYLANWAFLSGFTVTNGATRISGDLEQDRSGGGILCESTKAWVSNCVVVGNAAAAHGGGLSRGKLTDSAVLGNRAGSGGGGISRSTLWSCTLVGNFALAGGGANFGTLYDCVLFANMAQSGGGAMGGRLTSCTVSGNAASTSGGGAFNSEFNNSIIYGNTAGTEDANYYYGSINHSCTTPLPVSGEGNISTPPLFLDQPVGDLRLQSNSPCINAGNNAYVTSTNDLVGNPRIVGGTVDMGAFENLDGSTVNGISWGWLLHYGLPTDGSADYGHSDADLHNNWQEWKAWTNPTNELSVLRMLNPQLGTNGTLVSWESIAGHSYLLERATNAAGTFSLLQSNIVGESGVTSFTDTNIVGSGPHYYRVGVQE